MQEIHYKMFWLQSALGEAMVGSAHRTCSSRAFTLVFTQITNCQGSANVTWKNLNSFSHKILFRLNNRRIQSIILLAEMLVTACLCACSSTQERYEVAAGPEVVTSLNRYTREYT